MTVSEFIRQHMPDATQLERMLWDENAGRSLSRLDTAPVNSSELRQVIRRYANGPQGPFGTERLDLFHETHELFEMLAKEAGNERLTPYDLKNSFIGNEEADLIMLAASHESVSQEYLAGNVLCCSVNAIGERRTRLKDGVRIGNMCVQTDFGYHGEFKSSVHPICLPLNLSDVYVLLDALKSYEAAREAKDPHRLLCERISGMIHVQLSDYAKRILDPRFRRNRQHFRDENPVYKDDQKSHWLWIMLEKSGAKVEVELIDGSVSVGMIAHSPGKREELPELALKLDDGSVLSVPWADVVDIRRAGERE